MGIMVIGILVLIAIVYFYKDQTESKNSKPPVVNDEVSETDENKGVNEEQNFLGEIWVSATKGMLPGVNIIAGQTTMDEVNDVFGSPSQIDETTVGNFASYPNQNITIGYQNSIAFDLRSYHEGLQEIHYKEIIERLGEPDEIRYYQDSQYDQMILIYELNTNYQLKWILPRPKDAAENPTVHHTSVVAIEYPEQNQDETAVTVPEMVENMSTDEKIGQMIFAGIEGTEPNSKTDSLITQYKVGGIIFNGKNLKSPMQTLRYLNDIKRKNSQNRIPLFFGIDQEGGRIAKLPGELMEIPSNLEIGSINNPSFSYELGRTLGELVHAYGFNVDFAPVLDVNSNPTNPVIGDRSFGDNPEIVSKLGIQTMKGLQAVNIISTIKHFPGHGDTSVDSHLELPMVNKSLSELEMLELVPFKQAIKEGADVVMIAHILLPQIDSEYPSSMSKPVISDLLRNQLDYDGVVITDDLTMEAITDQFDIGLAAVESVKAGSDIVMVAHGYQNVLTVIAELKKAVEQGDIPEDQINESVTRILHLKEKYNVRDTIQKDIDIDVLNSQIQSLLDQYMQ